jgi:hypothetical protein
MGGCGEGKGRKEASASFLKKRSKKLLLFTRDFATAAAQTTGTLVFGQRPCQRPQRVKVFCFFFSKKKRFPSFLFCAFWP